MYADTKAVCKLTTERKRRLHNTRLVLFGHLASAFAKAVDNYLIFALQMSIKHLALLVIFR
jgi:hypothetical protein